MIIKLQREKIHLLIIGFIIIFLVLSITLAIKPLALFREVRNITRINHLKLVVDAIYFYLLREGKFPDCIPEFEKAIAVSQCSELREYLSRFPQDPDPKYDYFVEYFNKEKNRIRVYSSAPEAKGIEIIR